MPLGTQSAQLLTSSLKTYPVWEEQTPRWLLKFLPWVLVKSGIYRINRVTHAAEAVTDHKEGARVVETHADYQTRPRELTLSLVQSVLKVHTRIPDLHSAPHDQLREQLRLTIERLKEEKERALLNNSEYGLLSVAAEKMRIETADGPPTPNDLDHLLSLVWKKPAFFLAHPRAIAAFGQQCNERGLALETVEAFGVPFVTWRGVPLLPTDKLEVKGDKKGQHTTQILLVRVGEAEQGVVGLHQDGVGDEDLQSIAVRFMGIDTQAVASYLVTSYFSIAVLADDALGVLGGVKV